MRTFMAALASIFFFVFAVETAGARERGSGFSMGSSAFGLFERRKRVQRLRRRRAMLRRTARRTGARRVAVRKVRRSKARRTVRRKSGRKVALARKQRRSTKKRRTTSRRKVARTAKRSTKQFARRTVKYRTKQKPGTIIVDTKTRHLYYVLSGSKAIRYGVAVGKEGFAWSGVSRIRRKVKWPTWTPPREMIERKPELAEFAAGMPGGPKNPLGARALYLFQGKQDTLYRIHGTNNPASIGRAASSGCIRMRNDDVAHLYARVGMGAKVIVR